MGASKKQCEELLEFIRHLAEDDKEGVMAVKVNCTTDTPNILFPKKYACYNLYRDSLQWSSTITTSMAVGIYNKMISGYNFEKDNSNTGYAFDINKRHSMFNANRNGFKKYNDYTNLQYICKNSQA